MNLIAYNSVTYFDKEFSDSYKTISTRKDVKMFGELFYLYARNMSIVDRTGTITMPIKTAVLPQCQLPTFTGESFEFEEICNSRARTLMNQAIATDKKIVVMWSGGVDSTLILVSFLKTCTEEELSRIIVLLSKHSILENQTFYEQYVLKKFKLDMVSKVESYLASPQCLLVTGECCDQLFPGWQVLNYSSYYKNISVFDSYTQDNIIPYIMKRTTLSEVDSLKLYGLLDNLTKSCPIPITSLYHYFWWMHFTLKWQNVYTRMLMFVDTLDNIKFEENYTSFYIDPRFQLWSMNSIDLNVNTLNTTNCLDYKGACKQIIYKFDGNKDYLYNKGKFGSLNKVVMRRDVVDGIDEFGNFHKKIKFSEIYQPDNSFV